MSTPSPHPPGPDAGPFGVRNFGPFRADPLGFLARLCAEHGDLVRFELGATPYYLVNRPALVREVFVEHVHRIAKPAFLRDSNRGHWGDGLTTLEGEAWRSRRALLRPALGAEALAGHVAIVRACTEDAAAALCREPAVDLALALRTLTARIAARVLFDAEVEGFGTPDENRRRAGTIRLDEAFGEDFAVTSGDEAVAPITMIRPRAPARMETTLAIVDDRLRTREHRGDVLSFLVHARSAEGGSLARDEIVGEIVQMFFAGHLTVPSVLTRFFAVLADHPDVALRARAEADDPPAAGAPCYVERALKETMRAFPPAPILYRQVDEPFALDGHALPRGAAVWVSPQLLHHDPRHFPEPGQIRPERFDPAHEDRIPEYAYLPFGAGPRTCAGRRLALLHLTLIATTLLRRCRLVPRGDAAGRFDVARR